MDVTFEIEGKPFGKARPRKGKYGVYNPASNKTMEKMVREAFQKALGCLQEPLDGPVWLQIDICFEPPASVPRKTRAAMLAGEIYPTKKPDIDNCVKSVMDGLNGVAYYDDKQVVAIVSRKDYAEKNKTVVTVREVK